MKEIKFRAWDNQEQKMFFPSRIDFDCDGATIMCGKNYCNDDLEFDWFGNSKTLMQYTGLKDKNGVEIYEGDIMVYDKLSPSYYVVKCIDNSFVLDGNVTFVERLYFKEREVIGNIYENKELLNA